MVNAAGSDVHASVLAESLVALVENGTAPEPASGTGSVLFDTAMLALAAAALALGVRGVRRAGGWAGRRSGTPGWRTAVRLLPLVVPVVVLTTFDQLLGFLFQGRDVTWGIALRLFPSFVTVLGVVALVCAAVLAARLLRLRSRA